MTWFDTDEHGQTRYDDELEAWRWASRMVTCLEFSSDADAVHFYRRWHEPPRRAA